MQQFTVCSSVVNAAETQDIKRVNTSF